MSAAKLTRKQLCAAVYLALALVTLAVYWPVSRHEFINLDDQEYITFNPHVISGLTLTNVAWAFKTTEAANWHPLTWISHMADCSLYGVKPAGHHLTNLFFHIADTLLLFLLLMQLTGALWRSFFVAAFFAWHPLHVESVAWAAERKDVLSAFFWMLTLIAYVRYATLSKIQNPKSKVFYVLALFLFACGLMSKPMVVTLPFVLLLLDFWPLKRMANGEWRTANIKTLLVEKIPFFALAIAGSVVTYVVQKSAGAVWSAGAVPFQSHLANALLSYIRYISKTFCPVNMAVLYPYHSHFSTGLAVGAALVLAFWTGLFLWRARQNPYLIVGWLWFLGTLVPAIGLVQVGSQSMADRYMYLPSIGLFIIVTWGLNDFLNSRPQWRKPVVCAGGLALAGCLVCTGVQLGYWQNSIKLFRHTIEVTTYNYSVFNALGGALEEAGQKDEALLCYAESVQIEDHYPPAQYNLGMALLSRGAFDKACEHLSVAVKLVPEDAGARYSYGTALMNDGKLDAAAAQLTEAIRLRADFPDAQTRLAMVCLKQNKPDDAIAHFSDAAQLRPNDPDTRFNLGLALLDNHQPDKAATQFSEEARLTPNETKAHYRLAQALSQQNKPREAVVQYREALRLTPDFPDAKKELDEILAAHPELH
jgi:Flp pilus assembly protein TadD